MFLDSCQLGCALRAISGTAPLEHYDPVQQVERLLRQIDTTSEDGGIAYDDWLAAMLTWRSVRDHLSFTLHMSSLLQPGCRAQPPGMQSSAA